MYAELKTGFYRLGGISRLNYKEEFVHGDLKLSLFFFMEVLPESASRVRDKVLAEAGKKTKIKTGISAARHVFPRGTFSEQTTPLAEYCLHRTRTFSAH